MTTETHPINNFKKLAAGFPNAKFEFSKYIHYGHGKTKSREIFNVYGSQINQFWLENQIQTLAKEQELALHSKVIIKDDLFHIPMIDFINHTSIEKFKMRCSPVKLDSKIYFYDSGQSLHGYYFDLIKEKNWYRYLGKLLLCNPSNVDHKVVDPRPIGITLEYIFGTYKRDYIESTEERDWCNYFAKQLLRNPPDTNTEIVDSRWIAHSLENGYSALRWSRNSTFYKSTPKIKQDMILTYSW